VASRDPTAMKAGVEQLTAAMTRARRRRQPDLRWPRRPGDETRPPPIAKPARSIAARKPADTGGEDLPDAGSGASAGRGSPIQVDAARGGRARRTPIRVGKAPMREGEPGATPEHDGDVDDREDGEKEVTTCLLGAEAPLDQQCRQRHATKPISQNRSTQAHPTAAAGRATVP